MRADANRLQTMNAPSPGPIVHTRRAKDGTLRVGRSERSHRIVLLIAAAIILLPLAAAAEPPPSPADVTALALTEPVVPQNDLSRGGEIYRAECAACHAATGIGGALSFRDNAPPLGEFSAIRIAAAVRGGPGEMPSFGPETISDEELEQLVTYTLYLQDPEDPGGAPIGRVGPVMEGLITWFVAMTAIILGLMWIGERHA